MQSAVALSGLVALGERVRPLALAHERTVAVGAGFESLFVEGALVRGRTLACTGPAATSTALALVAPAVAAGAWLAVIDLPTIGLDAADELGVSLERVVAIASDDARRWPDVVAAAADGFDVLLVRVPAEIGAAAARKLAVRLRQRDAITVVLGEPGPLACDGDLRSDPPEWTGLGVGHGHLRARRVMLTASGRRIPGHRRGGFEVPDRA
jgi:hypothetical protein